MNSLRPGQLIALISGTLVFVFSFTDQVKDGGNAWKDFGLATFPAIIGALVAVVIAVVAFGNSTMPSRILGLTINQWLVVLSLAGMLLMIGLWGAFTHATNLAKDIADASGAPADSGTALTTTFYLSLVASIGLLVGTVVEQKADPASTGPAAPPSPF